MPLRWCAVCSSGHTLEEECPGDLPATGPERHGWRVNAETPQGIVAHGVMIAPSFDRWRARILTYPNMLWLAPGGHGAIKFVGETPQEAEWQAVEFIRGHCRALGHTLRSDLTGVAPHAGPGASVGISPPAPRKIRFMPVLFGVVNPSERGGTGNLSEGGLFIMTDSPVTSGTWLRMRLKIDEEPVALRGQVVWMRKQHRVGGSPGMGLRLQAPPTPYLDYVKQLP